MQTRKVLKVYSRTPYFSQFEAYKTEDEGSWFQLVTRSGLASLRTVGATYRDDDALLSAFVERWHPETNSFHFLWGELTITLHDVQRIMGLPIHGRSLSSATWTDSMVRERLTADLGVTLKTIQTWVNDGGIPCNVVSAELLKWLKEDDRDEFKCASYYMFLLLSSTVFVDKSTNRGKHHWFALLFDHGVTAEYAWGAGVLAMLYRQLGTASRRAAQGLAGCPILLRVRHSYCSCYYCCISYCCCSCCYSLLLTLICY